MNYRQALAIERRFEIETHQWYLLFVSYLGHLYEGV